MCVDISTFNFYLNKFFTKKVLLEYHFNISEINESGTCQKKFS